MTIYSRAIGYCFQEQQIIVLPILFGIFCNLIIPKQGIEMQIFFPNGLWRFLKNWASPHQVTFKCSPPKLQIVQCTSVKILTQPTQFATCQKVMHFV